MAEARGEAHIGVAMGVSALAGIMLGAGSMYFAGKADYREGVKLAQTRNAQLQAVLGDQGVHAQELLVNLEDQSFTYQEPASEAQGLGRACEGTYAVDQEAVRLAGQITCKQTLAP
jgi:hypothetical protein